MESKLPRRFEYIHNFSMYLHDSLVQIAIEGESEGIFNCETVIETEEKANKIAELSGEDLWDWLENEDEELVRGLSYKQIFVAVLADFCQFVFEALRTSRKGKLSVSYALLRKPFKDNLLFMEWLLADPKDLIESFFSDEAEDRAIDRVEPDRKKEIIEEAMDKTEFGGSFNSDFLYKLRYDKQAEFGFEQIWNKAIHLVTTFDPMKTEKQNLNFVFSDYEAKQSQWEYLYWAVPPVLYHTLDVAEALLRTIAEVDEKDMYIRSIIRNLKLVFAQESPEDSKEFKELLSQVGELLDFNCTECNESIKMSDNNIKSFATIGEVECQNCGETVDVKPLFKE